MSQNLKPEAAVASPILPEIDVLPTQHALPSKPNLIQTSQHLTKNMQTVSIHEQSNRHYVTPDTFQSFCGMTGSIKDDQERILIFGDPYMT